MEDAGERERRRWSSGSGAFLTKKDNMSDLEDRQLQVARQAARARFAELADVEPAVSAAPGGASVFTFRKVFRTADGAELVQVVRATVDANCRLLKVSTSKG